VRPLSHPAIEDVTVEGILHALSDPVRVAIYADIVRSACSQTCSTFLHVNEKAIPKSTLSLHFKILREAGLIRGERQGVEMLSTSRCAEIDKRFPGLIGSIIGAYQLQVPAENRPRNGSRRKPVKRASKKR
jgi:DNA-binding transcriptional ArsR family regulator